jgi:hypothetical protein
MAFRKHTPLDDCRKLYLFVAIDRTSKLPLLNPMRRDASHEKNQKSALDMIKIKSKGSWALVS